MIGTGFFVFNVSNCFGAPYGSIIKLVNAQMPMEKIYPKLCDGKLIFRRYRLDPKTGKRMDARKYGVKAWPICLGEWVANEKALLRSSKA